MPTMCTARRPDPTLEDQEKRKRFIIDMACPNESNKTEKIRKYQQLRFDIRERRKQFNVRVIATGIWCMGGGMKKLKEDIGDLFEVKELQKVARKMQKMVLWENESIMRKVLSYM